jgi:hypothetical protein
MKAEIIKGFLIIIPESGTEAYALAHFKEQPDFKERIDFAIDEETK